MSVILLDRVKAVVKPQHPDDGRYGWEPQLAELTWHALFLVPLWSMDPLFGWAENQSVYAIPTLVIWAIRFFILKIMLGAGLIKIKSSDPKWKYPKFSSMEYFYETQASGYQLYFLNVSQLTHVSSLQLPAMSQPLFACISLHAKRLAQV